MTAQHVTRFLARLATDSALRAELASQEVSAAALARVAVRHGYDFRTQELLARVSPLADDAWQAAARKFDQNAQLGRPDNYVVFLEEVPMSKEAVAAFFKKAAEDSALQEKLVELAAAEGFDFSSDELSDTDLDSIAGGIKLEPSKVIGMKKEDK